MCVEMQPGIVGTHSDGDCAGHRSEVSLEEFRGWSRLKWKISEIKI